MHCCVCNVCVICDANPERNANDPRALFPLAFVGTLTRFTSSVHQTLPLQPKQIAAVRALVKIALDNANFLQVAAARSES